MEMVQNLELIRFRRSMSLGKLDTGHARNSLTLVNEIPDWMRYSAPATPIPPSAAESLLSSSPPPPLPEKSLVLRLQESLTFGKKLLENKRATKDALIQGLRRIKFVCVSLFGKEAAIVKSFDC